MRGVSSFWGRLLRTFSPNVFLKSSARSFFLGCNSQGVHPLSSAQSNAAMTHFQAQHDARVQKLAEKMHEAFVAEDDGKFLACTGKLFRSNTLRTKN